MPTIRPSSDLRNKYNEISEFCNKYDEPVYITKNGQGDLAVALKKQKVRPFREALADIEKGIPE
ncbi:antitoxin PHD [Paenibacillus sp. SYP-B3998]|uniref:Antitoxin PHD n=1 Tax=Paenibacillus sp. SYP-B3998 TaxID=2678564 RepID=A0A6G3ZZH7_9BACL|nr:antitoxin PHD [Paenibacillus sp. SYP-B3998]NEW07626.1 antitoxin PHD [Paenibacillus sp. SYP-B3998]